VIRALGRVSAIGERGLSVEERDKMECGEEKRLDKSVLSVSKDVNINTLFLVECQRCQI